MNKTKNHSRRRQMGFTFIEVMVVVAILVLLATLIVPRLTGQMEQSKIDKATVEINELSKSLELYRLNNGFYPTTEQGLQALVERPETEPEPDEKKWKQILDRVPEDPWGNEYQYIQPGTYKDFDLFSYGPDGMESEDDITNWTEEDVDRAD